MIENLVAILNSEVGLSTEEIADILWLASIRQRHSRVSDNHSPASDLEVSLNEYPSISIERLPTSLANNLTTSDRYHPPLIETRKSFQSGISSVKAESQNIGSQLDLFNKPFRFPGAPAFREPLLFMKALRPLLQGIGVRNSFILDEVATINRIVDENIWMPVFREVPEPWLDLAFVVEESVSMLIWRQTILELRHFLKSYGLFRDVRTWGLLTDDQGLVRVRSGLGNEVNSRDLNSPRELLDPEGRRLILLVSDCISPIWYTGQILPTLDRWSNHGPMALLQMLPEWLWSRTALRQASSVFLQGLEPGISNRKLTVFRRFEERMFEQSSKDEKNNDLSPGLPEVESAVQNQDPILQAPTASKSGETTVPLVQIKMPVLTLEPKMAKAWSRMISGQGGVLAPGFLFNNVFSSKQDEESSEDLCELDELPKILTAKERVEQFWLVASSTAWNLVGLLAASPTISLPVVRLIQETLLPESRQVHVAEIMLGGLLKPIEYNFIRAETDPDSVTYQFVDPEIRSLLLESSSVKDTVSVLSHYIEQHFGRSLDSFLAYLLDLDSNGNALEDSVRPFAIVASEVLSRQGSRYAEFVQAVEHKYDKRLNKFQDIEAGVSANYPGLEILTFTTAQLVEAGTETWPPPLQIEEYTVATITFDSPAQSTLKVEPFTFKIGTIVRSGNTWEVQKSDGRAYRYVEQIDENVGLEMVGIAGGEFMMGSPAEEPESYDDERPQHLVKVPDFYLGRYPVTQAQWRSVAAMPQEERELDLDPSNFKGDTRPVEQVSWLDVIEFCARLSKHTKRPYRLPTEAEWEYACRAGTTTPFHFGETISTKLANCAGISYANSSSSTEESRRETTPVDHFEIANAWGLCNMYGNVWEWCEDHWHDNYDDAPEDGSTWLTDETDADRVRRGGSWDSSPKYCRSAFRGCFNPAIGYVDVGFRLASTGHM
jgi:formylglycine-generating enzyme required for sulfatase activity